MKLRSQSQSETIDVRQCSTPVMQYINNLRSQLSDQQRKTFREVCEKTREDYYQSIDNWSYKQLKGFSKFYETERLSTELNQQYPHFHRHLFISAIHYVMNGAQSRVESRRKILIKEAGGKAKLEAAAAADKDEASSETLTEAKEEIAADMAEKDVSSSETEAKEETAADAPTAQEENGQHVQESTTNCNVAESGAEQETPKQSEELLENEQAASEQSEGLLVSKQATPEQTETLAIDIDPKDNNASATMSEEDHFISVINSSSLDAMFADNTLTLFPTQYQAALNAECSPILTHAGGMQPLNDASSESVASKKKTPLDNADIKILKTKARKRKSAGCKQTARRPSMKEKRKGVAKKKGKKKTLPGPHCLGANCKHNGSGSGDMMRCIICNTWFHCDCTQAKINEDGAWTCPTCRKMPYNIKSLQSQMKELIEANKELSLKFNTVFANYSASHAKYTALQAENDELHGKNVKLTDDVKTLNAKMKKKKEENEKLRKEVHSLKKKKNTVTSQTQTVSSGPETASSGPKTVSSGPKTVSSGPATAHNKSPQVKQDLLIGDSIIRNIESVSGDFKVISISGANVDKITTYLHRTGNDTYENIIIVIGTNECGKGTCCDLFRKNMEAMLQEANRVAVSKVLVSSILPRVDDQEMMEKIAEFNDAIQELCQNSHCLFINNDYTFLYANGMPDFATLLEDGIHLSEEGSNRLCKNLNITTCINVVTRNHMARRQSRPSTQRHAQNSHYSDYRRDSSADPGYNSNYRNNRCYFCFEEGHTQGVCRHGDYIVCDSCGEYGHKAKHHREFGWD
jgi:cell division protein FtsB